MEGIIVFSETKKISVIVRMETLENRASAVERLDDYQVQYSIQDLHTEKLKLQGNSCTFAYTEKEFWNKVEKISGKI